METAKTSLNRFIGWLEEEATGWNVVKVLLFAFAIKLVYACSVDYVASFLQYDLSSYLDISSQPVSNASIALYSFEMLKLFFVGAVAEQLLFSVIPLYIAYDAVKENTGSKDAGVKAALAIAILTAMAYGYLSGGYENVLLQGVGCMIYSIAYLKLGGAQEKFVRGWFYSAALHFSFNVSVSIVYVLIHGQQYFTFTS